MKKHTTVITDLETKSVRINGRITKQVWYSCLFPVTHIPLNISHRYIHTYTHVCSMYSFSLSHRDTSILYWK